MSGHSKWSTIKRQKGINDAKKGAIFTKLAKAIAIAVSEGGGVTDPNFNFKLRLAMEKARQVNMPKDNINRAIDKAAGGGVERIEEVVFEGFLPGGSAVLVSALTDNRLRSAQAVREVLDKSGGSMGSSGSVSYLFSHKGELRIKNTGLGDEDELKMIDLGIDDIEMDDEGWTIYCDKDKTFEVKQGLENLGYTVESAELSMRPNTYIEVASDEIGGKIEAILEKLEDLDDVHKVWTNYLPV
jgi:YebC/PmpR family DNA-binding regulatory protein